MDGPPRPQFRKSDICSSLPKPLSYPSDHISFVFVSLPFQTANKGQIIIDRVKLSRFELKRRALQWLSLPL